MDELHRYHRNQEIRTARSFDSGQKLNPTFWSVDCRTPSIPMTAGPAIRSRTAPPAARATRSSRACRIRPAADGYAGGSSRCAASRAGVSLPRRPTIPCPARRVRTLRSSGGLAGPRRPRAGPRGRCPGRGDRVHPRREGRGPQGDRRVPAPRPRRSLRAGRPAPAREGDGSTQTTSGGTFIPRGEGLQIQFLGEFVDAYPNRDDLPSRRFGTVRPGHAAIFLSMTVACKVLEIDPFAYLRDVLDRVSTHPARCIDERLPGRGRPHVRAPGRPERRGSFAVRSDRTPNRRGPSTRSAA